MLEKKNQLIFLASDHRGYELKEEIKNNFIENNIKFIDGGAFSSERTDYNIFSKAAAQFVLANKAKAILICGSGYGVCMQSNRFKGIRAATIREVKDVVSAREHHDLNILCLGAEYTNLTQALELIKAFNETEFVGGHYLKRIIMLDQD